MEGASVLPDTALDGFPFSVGQASYGASVQVRRLDAGAENSEHRS
jgi:hypothetical protein